MENSDVSLSRRTVTGSTVHDVALEYVKDRLDKIERKLEENDKHNRSNDTQARLVRIESKLEEMAKHNNTKDTQEKIVRQDERITRLEEKMVLVWRVVATAVTTLTIAIVALVVKH